MTTLEYMVIIVKDPEMSLPSRWSSSSRIVWNNNLVPLCYREIYWCGTWWDQKEDWVLSPPCQSLSILVSMNSLQFYIYIWTQFVLNRVPPIFFTQEAVKFYIEKENPNSLSGHYLLPEYTSVFPAIITSSPL